MKQIRIYYEGNEQLKPGFHSFLAEIVTKARSRRIGFELIACDSTPLEDYQTALKKHPHAWNLLLRDSEGPDGSRGSSDSEFLMVQVMEAWFLADPFALEVYYGPGFKKRALKRNPKVEEIPKNDVLSCLRRATKDTQKGPYHKTKHAPDILGTINPTRVRNAAGNCERLFAAVLARL